MKRFLPILLVVLLFLPSLACGILPLSTNTVTGSGEITTQTIDVSGFHRVSLDGFGKVFIRQGESESLSIQTDENIHPYLEVRVQGGELILGTKPNVNLVPSQSITYNISVKDLEGIALDGSGGFMVEPITSDRMDISLLGSGDIDLEGLATGRLSIQLSGSGDINVSDIEAESVTTDMDGSGNITLDGTAGTQEIHVDGSGDIDAGDLETSTAEVGISGSADVTVWVTDQLAVDVDGSGDVSYYGNPSIDESGSGSADLIFLGEK